MRWTALLTGLAVLGCHEFLTLDRDRCGNRILEQGVGEDCDGDAPEGLVCGAPGQAGACRYLCQDAACPEGWGCGLDGVCRAPAGDFGGAEIVALPGETVSTGDVDGDGIDDLVGVSASRLAFLYGSADGRFGTSVVQRIPLPTEDPLLGDVDGDGRTDVVLALESGLMLLPGAADRTFVPAASPTREGPSPWRAFSVRATPPFQATETVEIRDNGTVWVRDEPLDIGDLELGTRPAAMVPAEQVAVADLDGGGTADEFALLRPRGNEVGIFSLDCPPQGPCELEARQRLRLPAGSISTSGTTFFGDLDGDGLLDLLVPVLAAGQASVAVAYGADGIAELAIEEALSASLRCGMCRDRERAFESVTDAADIDGDGVVDFANGLGVYRTVPGEPPTAVRLLDTITPYRELRLADLNADGRLDAFGGRPESVDMYLLGSDDRFSQFTLPLDGAIDQVLPGDFDGDGRTDLAVLETEGIVSVVFAVGEPYPNLRVVLGRAELAARIVVGQLLSGLGTDGADDLTFFDGARVYTFIGGSSRLPLALPRSVPAPNLIAVGDFDDAEGADVVVGSVRGQIAEFVRMDGTAMARGLPQEPQQLRIEGCTGTYAVSHFTRAWDLDGDGVDELIAVDARSPETNTLRIRIMAVEADTIRCVFSQDLPVDFRPAAVALADLDGDGQPELAAQMEFAAPAQQGLVAPEPNKLMFWSSAGLAFSTPVSVDAPGAEGMAVGPFGTGAALTWLSVIDGDLVRLRVADGQVVSNQLESTPVVDARGLAVGDVDGDALQDVVVKTGSGAVVLHQQACTAQSAATGRCTRPEP